MTDEEIQELEAEAGFESVLIINDRVIDSRSLDQMHQLWVDKTSVDAIAALYGLHRTQLGWCMRHHAKQLTMH